MLEMSWGILHRCDSKLFGHMMLEGGEVVIAGEKGGRRVGLGEVQPGPSPPPFSLGRTDRDM